MESREIWDERLKSEAGRLGFTDGYKFLYGPWRTIGLVDTFFLSLNPGRPPHYADLFTISDERGNSYEVERNTTMSPMTEQFLRLADMLSLRPSEILAGAVVPFRTRRWSTLSGEQKRVALKIGHEFWAQVFAARQPRLVIACCPEATAMSSRILNAQLEAVIPSGWGNTTLSRYCSPGGTIIIKMPHLSTFKLFSRPACDGPLKNILRLTL